MADGFAPDAYQQYLANQRAAKIAELAAGKPAARGFDLEQPFESAAAPGFGSKAFELQVAPEVNPNTPTENFQLPTPEMLQNTSMKPLEVKATPIKAPAAGDDYGGVAASGIEAAGATVSILAQIAAAQEAKEQMLAANTANRESSEKMAMANLLQNQSQFDQTSQISAYDSMLSMLGAAGNQTMQQRALNRANTQNQGSGLSTAFLGA